MGYRKMRRENNHAVVAGTRTVLDNRRIGKMEVCAVMAGKSLENPYRKLEERFELAVASCEGAEKFDEEATILEEKQENRMGMVEKPGRKQVNWAAGEEELGGEAANPGN